MGEGGEAKFSEISREAWTYLIGQWAGRRRRDRGRVAQGQVGVPPSLQPRHWVGGAHHCPPDHHDWQHHA